MRAVGEYGPAAGGGYSAEAIALFDRWVAASSPAPAEVKTATNRLINRLKDAGIWDQLDGFCKTNIHSEVASLKNWKADQYNLSVAAGAPTFVAYQGYYGDGVDDRISTGFNAATAVGAKFVQNSAHLGVFSLTDAQQASAIAGNSNALLQPRSSGDLIVGRLNSASTVTFANLSGYGHFAVSRADSTTIRDYQNGAQVAAAPRTSEALTSAVLSLFGRTGVSVVAAGTTLIHWGANLTTTQMAELAAANLEFDLAIGNPLTQFYYDLSLRNSAPVDILVMGDSITAGEGATALANRWLDLFRASMRTTFPTAGVTGGLGFRPTTCEVTTFTAWSDTSLANNIQRTLGPNGCAWRVNAGQSVTYKAVTGSTFKIMTTGSDGTGIAEVTIGGVPAADFNTRVPGGANQAVLSSAYAITGSPQDVVVTHKSGGALFPHGLMIYDGDETKGLRVWDAGHWGYDTDELMTSPPSGWLGTIDPALTIVMIGTNDWKNGNTPTVMKQNIQTWISAARAVCPLMPVLVVAETERSDVAAPAFPWADYVTALSEIASEDTSNRTAFLDLNDILGAVADDSADYADAVHPDDSGAIEWAATIKAALVA